MEGQVLSGRYRLIDKLGQGGMGSVWRAEHVELGTPCAVKLIDPTIATSPEAIARFKREAQSAAALRSTHVVQILDYGIDQQTPYIVMELLEGESLSARLGRLRCLAPEVLAEILTQVGRALTRAHERGIVHRDLKPDNIFLASEGDTEIAKVLDFGIAKAGSGSSTNAALQTRTGTMLGTPYYMSPEQASGKRSVDHRSDIWSLGIIAYECLTGVRPFESETLGAIVLAICTEPIPVPSRAAAVPPGFDAWFARITDRDPDRRFQSVAEALAPLAAICTSGNVRASQVALDPNLAPSAAGGGAGGYGGTVAPASVTMQGPVIPKSNRAWWWLAAFVGLAGVIVVAIFALRSISDADGTVADDGSVKQQTAGVPTVPPSAAQPEVMPVAAAPASDVPASPAPSASSTAEPAAAPPVVAEHARVSHRPAAVVRRHAAPASTKAAAPVAAAPAVTPVTPPTPTVSTSTVPKKRTLDERVGF